MLIKYLNKSVVEFITFVDDYNSKYYKNYYEKNSLNFVMPFLFPLPGMDYHVGNRVGMEFKSWE